MTQVARVLWRDVGRADEASAAVQGDRPTKPMPERLPESSRYPTQSDIPGCLPGTHEEVVEAGGYYAAGDREKL